MRDNKLVADLYKQNEQLKKELDNLKAELRVWYDNGVLLTSADKQVFYRMYREEQRKKREEEREKARKELDKITTRILVLKRKGGDKNEEGV